MSKPSFVFFMMDQLSAKWLEGDGASACPTPHYDHLKAEGVTFTNALTSNPLCLPARATLATGLTTRGHGVLNNSYELDPNIPNFMRILQSARWRTGALGKIHLLTHFRGVHPDYRPFGFDVSHNSEDPRTGNWIDWIEAEHPEHYEACLATAWERSIPELKAYGPDKIDLTVRMEQVRQAYDWSRQAYPYYYTIPFPEEISQTAWITDRGIDFIKESDPAQPIMAQISYVQPHDPSCPPAEYLDRIDLSLVPEPVLPEWADDPRRPTTFRPEDGPRTTIPDDWRVRRQHYFADVAHLDHQLGRVVKALRETGRWENTYLFFLSDHGELMFDHGLTGKGQWHYDACVRVPLTIVGPELKHGLVSDALVQLEDIMPTVLEIAGLPEPEPPSMGPYPRVLPDPLPGRSLAGLCRGEEVADWRDDIHIQSFNNLRYITPHQWARTIRTHEWRYTMYPQGHGEQLFNLNDDPDETVNLVYDSAYANVRREMRERLLEAVIMQDWPHSPRDLFAHGVH
jgi:arylsulfatase A-like enzyme